MVSIQTIMLVALGFLSALLVCLIIAPAFWRRAVRLTTQRLKEQLPLSDAEIRADKDRLRAEYAIRVHRLEMKVEQAELQKARQTIEINRRDGAISQLEQQQTKLKELLDENQNARRVLEQTVADRLPKVEQRLNEAKSLLFARDREIADLTQSTKRQAMALEEAHSINAQQTAELERMTNALTVRGARNQNALADPSFEGELALRAEIEALRAKTREQAGLIGRLQAQSGRGALLALGSDAPPPADLNTPHRANAAGDRANGAMGDRAAPPLALVAGPPDEMRAQVEREARALKAKADDQAAEIARLSAELQTLKSGADGNEPTGLRDSKIALKARLNAAQAEAEQNAETIKRLRAELAAANERLALQGAHFMEQMRRLGAGTLPAQGQTRRPVMQGQKLTLAERVAQSRTPLSPPTTGAKTGRESPQAAPSAAAEGPPSGGATPRATIVPIAAGDKSGDKASGEKVAAETSGDSGATAASDGVAAGTGDGDAAPRKPRLIDRISSINKA